MYHISLPAMAISPAFDCDKIIADARLVGASRIMLAIDTLSNDKSRMDRYFDILRDSIDKIHAAGLEACVWFWALRIMEDGPFVRLTDRRGDKCRRSHRCCPLDEDVLQYMEDCGIIGEALYVDVAELGDIELKYGSRFTVKLGDTTQLFYKIKWE